MPQKNKIAEVGGPSLNSQDMKLHETLAMQPPEPTKKRRKFTTKKEIPGMILSLTDFIPNTTRFPLHDLQIYLCCG